MRIDLKSAYEHLVACRPIAEPNSGFMAQLKAFEQKELGTMSDIPLCKYVTFTKDELATEKQKIEQSQKKELNDGMQLLNQMKDKKEKE